jgi:hypothetical protein
MAELWRDSLAHGGIMAGFWSDSEENPAGMMEL